MDVLMIRLDVYEELHDELRYFWNHIIDFISRDNVELFIMAFSNEEMGQRISPELFAFSESHYNIIGTQLDLEGAQQTILQDLGYVDDGGNKEKIQSFLSYASTKEFVVSREEYYEIEESKKIIIHDWKEQQAQGKKEMKKFWNHIDTLIINSYEQLLYDITGSDDFVRVFMNELKIVGIMENLRVAKRKQDYEFIINTVDIIDEHIGNWILDIEQLVGVEQ